MIKIIASSLSYQARISNLLQSFVIKIYIDPLSVWIWAIAEGGSGAGKETEIAGFGQGEPILFLKGRLDKGFRDHDWFFM